MYNHAPRAGDFFAPYHNTWYSSKAIIHLYRKEVVAITAVTNSNSGRRLRYEVLPAFDIKGYPAAPISGSTILVRTGWQLGGTPRTGPTPLRTHTITVRYSDPPGPDGLTRVNGTVEFGEMTCDCIVTYNAGAAERQTGVLTIAFV